MQPSRFPVPEQSKRRSRTSTNKAQLDALRQKYEIKKGNNRDLLTALIYRGTADDLRAALDAGALRTLTPYKSGTYAALIPVAVHAGDIEKVRILLQAAPAFINERFPNDESAIAIAAMRGRDDILQLLLTCDPESIDIPDRFGETPLFHAAMRLFSGTVELLVRAGSRKLESTTPEGLNIFDMVIGFGEDVLRQITMLETLVRLGARNIDDPPILELALSEDRKSKRGSAAPLMEALVRVGSFLGLDRVSKNGTTPLDFVIGNFVEIICNTHFDIHTTVTLADEENQHRNLAVLLAVGARDNQLYDFDRGEFKIVARDMPRWIVDVVAIDEGLGDDAIAIIRTELASLLRLPSVDEIEEIRYRVYFREDLLSRLLNVI